MNTINTRQLREALIPACAEYPPATVLDANAEVVKSIAKWEAMRPALREAEQAVRQAKVADQEALSAAVAAGKSAPAKPTEPAAVEELERLRRTVQELARQIEPTMKTLDRTVRDLGEDGLRQWAGAERAGADELVDAAGELCDQLLATFEQLADRGALLDGIERRAGFVRDRRTGLPSIDPERSFAQRRQLGVERQGRRPDGSVRRTGKPVPARPDALVQALADAARELVPERRFAEPAVELAAGGVYAGVQHQL